MAARNIYDQLFRFLADTKSLERGNKRAQQSLSRTQKSAAKVSGAFSSMLKLAGGIGVAMGGRELLQWVGDSVQVAIAAEEVDSKFEAVFGTARKLNDALEQWGNMAGVTTTQARDLASTFGNLAMAQGISASDTETLTMKVAELAGDMASFNDSDPSMVFNDLNKALLTTEREGMKKYGIALTESEIKQKALEIATEDGRSVATKADRAFASYALAVQQAGRAVGDLERTQDSLANRQRRVTASVQEMKEAYGRELLPILDDVTSSIDGQDSKLEDLGATAGRVTAGMIGPLTDSMSGLATATDTSSSGWDRFKGSLGFAYDVTRQFSPWLRGLNALIKKTGEETVDSDLYMSEFAKGMKETAQAIADASGIADPYLEFLALMRQGIDNVATAAATGLSKVQLFNDEVSMYDISGSQAAAAAARAAARGGGSGGIAGGTGRGHALKGYASGGVVPGQRGKARLAVVHGGERISTPGQQGAAGSVVVNFNGVVGDPVAVAQQIKDLIELADRTGG